MDGHNIICVGASAGGVEALTELVRDLPPDLPASIFVVLHIPPDAPSVLPAILNRCGTLPASHPTDGQAVQPGRIYVAPPDRHLLVKDGHIRLARGPRENGHRPGVDPLFRTAAVWHGPRVIGVVLSGTLDDGAAGLLAVKERGGLAVVQDPDDALQPSMPRAAAAVVEVDYCLPVAQIGEALVRLVAQPPPEEGDATVPRLMEIEARIAEADPAALESPYRPGRPSAYRCPECSGVLWEIRDGELTRYRCRVGHAYAPESLLSAQNSAAEDALWTAMDALEERTSLTRRLAKRLRQHGAFASAERFEEQMRHAELSVSTLREMLVHGPEAPSAAGGDLSGVEDDASRPEGRG